MNRISSATIFICLLVFACKKKEKNNSDKSPRRNKPKKEDIAPTGKYEDDLCSVSYSLNNTPNSSSDDPIEKENSHETDRGNINDSTNSEAEVLSQDFKKDKIKCLNDTCKGTYPDEMIDKDEICQECRTNIYCKYQYCQKKSPYYTHTNGYCNECGKLKMKCRSGVACAGILSINTHNQNGYCTYCLEVPRKCSFLLCIGADTLKRHENQKYCDNCINTPIYCRNINCEGKLPYLQFDKNLYCFDCKKKKGICRHIECKGNRRISSFNKNGYCPDCLKLKSSCYAEDCQGNYELKNHNKYGICKDCLKNKNIEINLNKLTYNEILRIIEQLVEKDLGILKKDQDNNFVMKSENNQDGSIESIRESFDASQPKKLTSIQDDNRVNIQNYLEDLHDLGLIKITYTRKVNIYLDNHNLAQKIDEELKSGGIKSAYDIEKNISTNNRAILNALRLLNPIQIPKNNYYNYLINNESIILKAEHSNGNIYYIKST